MEQVRSIDRLRPRPAQSSTLDLLAMFYVDRLAAVSAAAAGMVASWVFIPSRTQSWRAALLIVAVLALYHFVFGPRRTVDPAPRLTEVAERIAGVLKVRTVVFGHSHDVERSTFGRATYFNPGSFWSPRPPGIVHVRLHRDPGGELEGGLYRSSSEGVTEFAID